MKLILGTAEFGPKAYGTATEPIPLAEVEKIFRIAYKGGIETLEGAESYKCDTLLQNTAFNVIYKVTHPYNLDGILKRLQRTRLTGLLYHHGFITPSQMPLQDVRIDYRGSSVYSHKQILGSEDIIEVPLNIENTEFEKVGATVKLVRSVFGRGELLKKYSVKDCLDFIKKNSTVHGVVVGVNSGRELEEILKYW